MALSLYRRHSKSCGSRDSLRCSGKHHCKLWVYGTLLNGTVVRQSLETRDHNDALKKVAEFERKGELPTAVGKTTIDEWRSSYLENAATENLSHETLRKYRHLFAQLDAFARDKGFRYVEELDLDEVLPKIRTGS